VLPEHWSTGAGWALMNRALEAFAGLRLAPVLLWVFTDNPRARRFYERAGFAPDGTTHTFEIAGAEIPELRYRHPGLPAQLAPRP